MVSESDDESSNSEFAQKLMQGDFKDVLVLDFDSAKRVLPDERKVLFDAMKDGEDRSIRDLADDLGRDEAAVSRDLDLLSEYDIVEYERDGPRKIPKPKHETVLVKPIL